MKTLHLSKDHTIRRCLFRAEIGDMVECYIDCYGVPQIFHHYGKKLFPVIGTRPDTYPVLGSDASGGGLFLSIGSRKYFYNFTWIKDFGASRFMLELHAPAVVARIIKKKS